MTSPQAMGRDWVGALVPRRNRLAAASSLQLSKRTPGECRTCGRRECGDATKHSATRTPGVQAAKHPGSEHASKRQPAFLPFLVRNFGDSMKPTKPTTSRSLCETCADLSGAELGAQPSNEACEDCGEPDARLTPELSPDAVVGELYFQAAMLASVISKHAPRRRRTRVRARKAGARG